MPYKTLIELDKLKEHFHEPMADVARKFGVCTTFFKRMCRTYGIKRWPFRKLQSIEKKISQIQDLPHNSDKLSELNAALKHIQSTGRTPSNFALEMDTIAQSPTESEHPDPQPLKTSKQQAEQLCVPWQQTSPAPVQHAPALSHLSTLAPQPRPVPQGMYSLPQHPLQQPPLAIPNAMGGLTLLLHDRDQYDRKTYQAAQRLWQQQVLLRQQQELQQLHRHIQKQHQMPSLPHYSLPYEMPQDVLAPCREPPEAPQVNNRKAFEQLSRAWDNPCAEQTTSDEVEGEMDDVSSSDEEASMILGSLARENLFRHSIFECSSNQIEHKSCIERFDNIQGAAVYIFEIAPCGKPCFKYMSRGSNDVYGLTPQQATHPSGCERILGVIHEEDQASFLSTVQESRTNMTEWIWRGRTMIPKGAAAEAFATEYKGIYARSVPTKLEDGTVRWEGFLIEVEPLVNGDKSPERMEEEKVLEQIVPPTKKQKRVEEDCSTIDHEKQSNDD